MDFLLNHELPCSISDCHVDARLETALEAGKFKQSSLLNRYLPVCVGRPRRCFDNTPARLGRTWCLDPLLSAKIVELRRGNRLRHEVCEHLLRRTIFQHKTIEIWRIRFGWHEGRCNIRTSITAFIGWVMSHLSFRSLSLLLKHFQNNEPHFQNNETQ